MDYISFLSTSIPLLHFFSISVVALIVLKEKLQVRWDQRLEQLKQYKELHGHCNVPSTARGDYSGLGQWLASTRMKKRKGHLSDSKTQDLEDIGVEWSLKRTTKATVSNSQITSEDFYDDDDSESNNNDTNENIDDYDDDDSEQASTTPSNPNASNINSNTSTSITSIANITSASSNPNNNINTNTYANSSTPNKDRPYILPPPPNPNITPANQSKNSQILDFLTMSIGDITAVKKDKAAPQ